VVRRDPHQILGVEPGADPATIKAAWRRLARVNHPDLTGDDPAASQAATRRMAEINEAYAVLTRDQPGRRTRTGSAGADPDWAGSTAETRARPGGPPRPKPTRPVTGRVDTSSTVRPRNQTTGPGAGPTSGNPASDTGRGSPLNGQPPLRGERVSGEPPRASMPTGPLERDRVRDFRRPKPPALAVARAHGIDFGKFHGHTLGEIAAFEPSYIDWVAGTVTRDPELVAAARVIQRDLDARGVARRTRPTPVRAGRSA
jgi:DnaJ domain/Exodeoxyribonuclease X-like C-terminal